MERMGLAADLVLDGEQHVARVDIDYVLEPVFVFIDLHRDEAELL